MNTKQATVIDGGVFTSIRYAHMLVFSRDFATNS